MAGQTARPRASLSRIHRAFLVIACGSLFALIAGADTSPVITTAPAPATASQPATRTAEQKKQDDIKRVMEFFRITQPDVYQQALLLRETEPQKFEKLISGATSTVNRLESMRRRNPKLFELSIQDLKLNYQTLRLAHLFQDTSITPHQRDETIAQLKRIVAEEFDVQQEIRRLEIDDLKRKIAELEERVCIRQADKDSIIGKRVQDLTEHTPKLEW